MLASGQICGRSLQCIVALISINLISVQTDADLLKSFSSDGTSSVNQSDDPLMNACNQGLNFASLSDFERFIQQFKARSLDQSQRDTIPSKCANNQEAILELEPLITNKDVCDPSKIDALLAYHQKYLTSSGLFTHPRRKPITQRFFRKFAIQVAYTCKKNLIRNLEMSREELRARSYVFEKAREKIYNDEPSIKSNIKLIQEQPDEPSSTNVKPRDKAEMSLNEYRDALTKLKRPEDILTFDRSQCLRSKTRYINISRDKLETFFKPAMMCLQLARYYSGSILSIAKLVNTGYIAVDDELDVKLADSLLVKDWIVATQVCEPMLYMTTQRYEGDIAVIDTCSERVTSIETMAFDDNFTDFDNEALDEMVPKSEATRHNAQKIMKSVMKKMAKVNLMHQLKSGTIKKRSIFSKSLQMLYSTGAMGSRASIRADSTSNSHVSEQMTSRAIDMSSLTEQSTGQTPDEKSFEELIKVLSDKSSADTSVRAASNDENESEGAVSMFDPLSSLASSITVIAIMLCFEWLFFIVMTLAARICHRLNFNFDNLLTFPPRVLSWSDADFTQFNEELEMIDEDDFFDYGELNPDEQKQRDMLAKVFGKPPPMLFRVK